MLVDVKNGMGRLTPDSGLLERTLGERPVPASGIPSFRGSHPESLPGVPDLLFCESRRKGFLHALGRRLGLMSQIVKEPNILRHVAPNLGIGR